jgi:hypothetical protein
MPWTWIKARGLQQDLSTERGRQILIRFLPALPAFGANPTPACPGGYPARGCLRVLSTR